TTGWWPRREIPLLHPRKAERRKLLRPVVRVNSAGHGCARRAVPITASCRRARAGGLTASARPTPCLFALAIYEALRTPRWRISIEEAERLSWGTSLPIPIRQRMHELC